MKELGIGSSPGTSPTQHQQFHHPQLIMNENSSSAGLTSNNNTSTSTGNNNSSRYKTELCRPFSEYRHCKYGEKCQFAHGIQELRRTSRHPKYKTELCKTFHTMGLCPYGHRCHFVHNHGDGTEQENNGQQHQANNNNSKNSSPSPPGTTIPTPTSPIISPIIMSSTKGASSQPIILSRNTANTYTYLPNSNHNFHPAQHQMMVNSKVGAGFEDAGHLGGHGNGHNQYIIDPKPPHAGGVSVQILTTAVYNNYNNSGSSGSDSDSRGSSGSSSGDESSSSNTSYNSPYIHHHAGNSSAGVDAAIPDNTEILLLRLPVFSTFS